MNVRSTPIPWLPIRRTVNVPFDNFDMHPDGVSLREIGETLGARHGHQVRNVVAHLLLTSVASITATQYISGAPGGAIAGSARRATRASAGPSPPGPLSQFWERRLGTSALRGVRAGAKRRLSDRQPAAHGNRAELAGRTAQRPLAEPHGKPS